MWVFLVPNNYFFFFLTALTITQAYCKYLFSSAQNFYNLLLSLQNSWHPCPLKNWLVRIWLHAGGGLSMLTTLVSFLGVQVHFLHPLPFMLLGLYWTGAYSKKSLSVTFYVRCLSKNKVCYRMQGTCEEHSDWPVCLFCLIEGEGVRGMGVAEQWWLRLQPQKQFLCSVKLFPMVTMHFFSPLAIPVN